MSVDESLPHVVSGDEQLARVMQDLTLVKQQVASIMEWINAANAERKAQAVSLVAENERLRQESASLEALIDTIREKTK